MSTPSKEYLGDSVYAEWDGVYITLTTENGLPDDPSNTIMLDQHVIEAFLVFINRALGEPGDEPV